MFGSFLRNSRVPLSGGEGWRIFWLRAHRYTLRRRQTRSNSHRYRNDNSISTRRILIVASLVLLVVGSFLPGEYIQTYISLRFEYGSSMEQFHWPTVRRESFVAGFVALSIFFRLVPRLFWKVGTYVFAVHAYVLKGHPCVPVAFRVDSARGIVASRDFPIRDLIFFPTISSQYSLLLRSRTRIFQSLRIRERHEVGNGSREFLLTILSKFTCTYVRVYVRKRPTGT